MTVLARLREAARGIDLTRGWNHAAGLLLPAAALTAAGLGERAMLRLPPEARGVLVALPVLIALTGLALAWRFDRGRLLHCLALVLAVFLIERALAGAADGHGVRLAWAMLCVATPLVLLTLAVLDDPGVLAPWRDRRFALFATPPLLVATAVVAAQPVLLEVLATPIAPLGGWSRIPALGLLGFAAAAAWLGWRYFRAPSLQRGVILGVLAALLVVLHRPDRPELMIAMASGAALMLTFATLQESWNVAYVDPLTELPGRRALEELMRRLPARYAIAMVDVDHFKRFNDTHGHHVGDEVLRLVAAHLREVGGGGLPHRYGGEEFTLVFPGLDAESALPHVDAVREEIDAARFELRRGERRVGGPAAPETPPTVLGITVSIGVADHRSGPPSATIEAADGALYEAKRGGRNRSCLATSPSPPGSAGFPDPA